MPSLIAALAVSLGLFVPAASATSTVDGRVTAADGYIIVKELDFIVQNVDDIRTGGMLWLRQAANGDLFVAFSLPKTLVDNSYGSTAIGWGKDVAPSGKEHNFEDLVGSDDARFVFRDTAGETLFDVTLDYLYSGDHEKPPYQAGKTDSDKEFKVHTGDVDDLLAATSSLFYNWVTFGGDYPELFGKDSDSPAADSNYNTTDPALSGWLFDVTYEFQIAGDAFGATGINLFDDDSVSLVHASPNKIGKNKVQNFIVINTSVVPEPLTMLGVLLGVGGLGGYIRRRNVPCL